MRQPDAKDLERARLHLLKCEEDLESARSSVDSHPNTAVTKAYYSLFHAVHAAVAVYGDNPVRHDGVSARFSLHYVKEGLLPRYIASSLGFLLQSRQKADYDLTTWFDSADARLRIEHAEKSIGLIRDWLERHFPAIFEK